MLLVPIPAILLRLLYQLRCASFDVPLLATKSAETHVASRGAARMPG
jgi:hypothetical protein